MLLYLFYFLLILGIVAPFFRAIGLDFFLYSALFISLGFAIYNLVLLYKQKKEEKKQTRIHDDSEH